MGTIKIFKMLNNIDIEIYENKWPQQSIYLWMLVIKQLNQNTDNKLLWQNWTAFVFIYSQESSSWFQRLVPFTPKWQIWKWQNCGHTKMSHAAYDKMDPFYFTLCCYSICVVNNNFLLFGSSLFMFMHFPSILLSYMPVCPFSGGLFIWAAPRALAQARGVHIFLLHEWRLAQLCQSL